MLWNRKFFSSLAFAASLSANVFWNVPVKADTGGKLQPYNAAITDTSISGISSGAFMAVQFGVASSSIVKGVGVVAGGPYYCSQASWLGDVFSWGWGPIISATGACMKGPVGDLEPLVREAKANAASGDIDPLDNLARQKLYLFHGYNDAEVAKSVSDAAVKFYRSFVGDEKAGNIFYQSALGAGHSFVVVDQSNPALDNCPDNKAPYIDQCAAYDQAGVILQHIYGKLNPPSQAPLGGDLKTFDQSLYVGDSSLSSLSMGKAGYVYVPKDCGQMACRVHVALHGCQQYADKIGALFVESAGYNRWADSNRIIVLYPQTTSSYWPFNPKGCWDWWGYVSSSDSYVMKSGKQITAIKAMIDALTAGAQGPATDPAAATFSLIANDRSDAAVALAWTAAPGASSYQLSRAGADGRFQDVATVSGLSYADQGLASSTSYTWQLAPVVSGVAQAPLGSVTATTLATPAPCKNPGSCPLTQ